MHAIERAEYILAMLEKNKVVMVADLTRVHGGAYLNEGYGN